MIHDIFGDHVLTHLPSETKHSFPDLNHHERINFFGYFVPHHLVQF